MQCGVLVGTDVSQEWLLVWFYEQFRKHNPTCPIAFADFGMTSDAHAWCKERGTVFRVEGFSLCHAENGEFVFRNELWQANPLNVADVPPERQYLFYKPIAFAQSPFQRTLWLDLDCQVRGDLSSLLNLPLSPGGVAVASSGKSFFVKNQTKNLIFLIDKYNSGVMLAETDSELVKDWRALADGRFLFPTDEEILSFLMARHEVQISQLEFKYNWPVHFWGENEEALIYHWIAKEGKSALRKLISTLYIFVPRFPAGNP
jgi:hypothetical protein